MTVWIESEKGLRVFGGVRSVYQKNNMIHLIDAHGTKRILDGTIKYSFIG